MPCKNTKHSHNWDISSNLLLVERCEKFCGLCTGLAAAREFKFAWHLRRHVRQVHVAKQFPELVVPETWTQTDQAKSAKAAARYRAKKARRAASVASNHASSDISSSASSTSAPPSTPSLSPASAALSPPTSPPSPLSFSPVDDLTRPSVFFFSGAQEPAPADEFLLPTTYGGGCGGGAGPADGHLAAPSQIYSEASWLGLFEANMADMWDGADEWVL